MVMPVSVSILGRQRAARGEDGDVSSVISRASCRTDAHESPPCQMWQIRLYFSKYKDRMKLERKQSIQEELKRTKNQLDKI
jgi:hypothetical protein